MNRDIQQYDKYVAMWSSFCTHTRLDARQPRTVDITLFLSSIADHHDRPSAVLAHTALRKLFALNALDTQCLQSYEVESLFQPSLPPRDPPLHKSSRRLNLSIPVLRVASATLFANRWAQHDQNSLWALCSPVSFFPLPM